MSAVEAEFEKVKQKLDQNDGNQGREGKPKGFLPLKELKPPKLAKEEQWRGWAEHFSEYVEASTPGMKECLRAAAQHENKADKHTVSISSYSAFEQHSEHLYSALKHLMEEGTTARNVVLSTPQEDGFLAWWSLSSTFSQALAGRQGSVMSQFTAAHAKPARNTSETKGEADRGR